MASPKAGVAADSAAPGSAPLEGSRMGAANGFAWIWLPLVLVALLVIYLPGLGNALVFDDGYLADGELFADYASAFQLRERILSYGSFVWLQAIFGEGWWKQRLFNLLLHCSVVVSLWALYRELLRHVEVAPAEPHEAPSAPLHQSPALGLAIGFFALNPVAVYAVAYLIQRSILMATLFVVLGLWFFARGLAERRPSLHILALACYVLAVMSKEHALLAPLAAAPLYILVARPSMGRLALVATIGAIVVAAAAALLSHRYGHILGKAFDEYSHIYLAQLARIDPAAEKNAFALSILNQAYLFFHYGLRWLLPAAEWMSINLRPPFPVSLASFPHVLGIFAYAGVLIGGFFLLLRYRDWRTLAGVSLLMPALLFATEFATVWVQDPFVLYRSYLWAISVPGLLVVMLHGPSARTLAIVGLALAAGLSWQALDRIWSLSTVESAWTDAIRKLPNDPRSVGRWFPYLNRGSFYAEHNQFKLALRDFEASAALGDLGIGSFNKGSILGAEGQHAKALEAFDEAERQGYKLYNLPFQRAMSLMALGKPAEAYQQLLATHAMSPPSPTRELMYLHLGRLGMQLGKADEAIASLRQLATHDPKNKEGRFLLAMAHVMKNEHADALRIADELLREDSSGGTYYARALANFGLKRKAEALADIENALRQSPGNSNLLQWQEKIRAMP
jgi:protein O-mannosyl-transferase